MENIGTSDLYPVMLHMNVWKDGGIGGGDGNGYNRLLSFYTDLCKIYTVHCIKLSALPVHSPVFFIYFSKTF